MACRVVRRYSVNIHDKIALPFYDKPCGAVLDGVPSFSNPIPTRAPPRMLAHTPFPVSRFVSRLPPRRTAGVCALNVRWHVS